MKDQLEHLRQETIASIHEYVDADSLRQLEIQILGKKGKLTDIMRGLKDLSLEDKKSIGPLANKVKRELEDAFTQKLSQLQLLAENAQLESEWTDVTYSKKKFPLGKSHPITQIIRELEDVFRHLGFSLFDGPELDTEYDNFDALNIPATHPARDMQDTFFVDIPETEKGKWVMRTHTSNLQNRVYREFKPPFRVFISGTAFRNEATDATHDTTFHQCEGIVVGKDVSLAHLKYVIEEALTLIMGYKITTRFRPGYFPFVEPGLELDFYNEQLGKWVEFMGCGMIHPRVLEEGGIDPDEYRGFAFGFGVARLAMMRYGITDLRLFFQGDQRFVEQF